MKGKILIVIIFIVFFIKTTYADTPRYFNINSNEINQKNNEPKISATSYLVGDLNTGEIIISKNQNTILPMASISKLMTAIVTEDFSKNEEYTEISKKALATNGKNGELKLGEKIKVGDLIYPLLLESSNDAAEALAEYFGRDNFISKMNQKAKTLKMDSTKYEDPSGLSENNDSTAADLFKLTCYITQNQNNLFKITTLRSYNNQKHNWSNISQFLKKDEYIGGKSGYTDKAKQTVISLFSLELGQNIYRPICIVLLGSNDRKRDVESILKYLDKNIYYGGSGDAKADWVKEKIGRPEINEQQYINMSFGGDIMLDRGVRNSVVKNFNNDYSSLFEKLPKLKLQDIVFANLEGTASDKGKDLHNLYSFRMDPSVIPTLAGAGINILSVANNHIGDFGLDAYIDTLSRLKENEILYTGGGNNKIEAETPAITEKYGMKIGFLGFSDKGPEGMEATDEQAGILLANNKNFDQIIQNASKKVDYLIVSIHFGEEYQNKHNQRQEYLAHKAIDDGAKIIIGSHPHVVEDTEVYSKKDCTQSSCVGYIAYSLGNFIFDQSWSTSTMQGMILNIKLWRDGSMNIRKDTIKLNKAFQPDQILIGKEEKIKFK